MNEKLTKNQRREQAREQARLAREAEKKREKRNRLYLQGGIALVIIAVLGIVALVLTQSMKPAGPGPLNMISGGVTFGKDLKVVETKALQPDEKRESLKQDWTTPPVDVSVYVDYMCPACGNFEAQNGTMLEQFVGSGDVELTTYIINFLDGQSLGTKYSTRAANIVSCVVDQQPDSAFALHTRLLSQGVQPAEGSTGLTDEQLLENAEAAGATANTELKQCVKDVRFGGFIDGNYKQVSEVGVIGLAEGAQLMNPQTNELVPADQPQRLMSTPLVLVNGQQWVEGRDGGLEQYILKIKSELEGAAKKADAAKTDAAKTDAEAETPAQ